MTKHPCPTCKHPLEKTCHSGQKKRDYYTCTGCGEKWVHYYQIKEWKSPIQWAYETRAEARKAKLESNKKWKAKAAANRPQTVRKKRASLHDAHVKAWAMALRRMSAPPAPPVQVPKPAPAPAPAPVVVKPKRRTLDDLMLERELFAKDPLFAP